MGGFWGGVLVGFGLLVPWEQMYRQGAVALVGVEYLRPAVAGQRLVQRLDAKSGVHGVRQPVHQL